MNIDNHLICPPKTINVNFDGVISSGEYNDALIIDGTTYPSPYKYKFYLKYDSTYLYIGAEGFNMLNDNDIVMGAFYDFGADGILTPNVDRFDLFTTYSFYGIEIKRIDNHIWTGYWNEVGTDGSWSYPYQRAYQGSSSDPNPHQQIEARLKLNDTNVQLEPGDSVVLALYLMYRYGNHFAKFPLYFNSSDPLTWFNLTLTTEFIDNPPTSNQPNNRTLYQGQTGNDTIITWYLSDDIGGNTYNLYLNNESILTNQSWPIGGVVNYQFDTNMSVGIYNITIEFYDTAWQRGVSEVIINLIAPSPLNSPPNIISITIEPEKPYVDENINVYVYATDDFEVTAGWINV
ncbi:MAG: hypothetical protein ACTSRZ_10605 [Promethearchaeota archaeon]